MSRIPKPSVKLTIAHKFSSSKDLDDFVKRSEREKRKIHFYDHELKQLDRRLLKPIDKSYTARSWEIFVDLLTRICRDKLYHHYRQRLFYIAQKIVFKDFAADHKQGTFR